LTDTKVYIALMHLDTYELNRFKKYVDSPYFNVNESLSSLFEIYYDHIKNGKKEELSKQVIWSIVYPNEEFKDSKYRKLNSDLLRLFEGFLAQDLFEKDSFLKNNLILKAIGEKKIRKLYKATVSSTTKALDMTYNRSADYLLAKYQNEKEKLNLYPESEILRKRSKTIEKDVNIAEISKYLDQFYIAEKLKYYVKLLGWKKLISLEQDINHTEILDEMLDEVDYTHIAPIMIYSTISKTQLHPDNEENYIELKKQVNEFIDYFPDMEIRNIYDALLSFCVRRVNKGDLSYQEEALEVYKDALQKEVLMQNGYMTAVTFNNIVFFALRTGAYDWAEQFISEYSPMLNEKDRISSTAMSRARLEFYRKDYEKVIELLQQVEMESVVFNLNAKTILLFSYYELDEFDALDSFVNSFRVYVNREKSISSRKKSHYKNLIKFIKKIINVRYGDTEAIEKIKQELTETPGVVSKPYLLEKLNEKV